MFTSSVPPSPPPWLPSTPYTDASLPVSSFGQITSVGDRSESSSDTLYPLCLSGKMIKASYVPLPTYHNLFPDAATATQLLAPPPRRWLITALWLNTGLDSSTSFCSPLFLFFFSLLLSLVLPHSLSLYLFHFVCLLLWARPLPRPHPPLCGPVIELCELWGRSWLVEEANWLLFNYFVTRSLIFFVKLKLNFIWSPEEWLWFFCQLEVTNRGRVLAGGGGRWRCLFANSPFSLVEGAGLAGPPESGFSCSNFLIGFPLYNQKNQEFYLTFFDQWWNTDIWDSLH